MPGGSVQARSSQASCANKKYRQKLNSQSNEPIGVLRVDTVIAIADADDP